MSDQNNKNRNAKVFARLFGYAMPPGTPDGSLQITVEYKLLSGTRAGSKVTFTISDIVSDAQISSDIREALANHLTTIYAPEVFRPRDIVGYSV